MAQQTTAWLSVNKQAGLLAREKMELRSPLPQLCKVFLHVKLLLGPCGLQELRVQPERYKIEAS